MRGGVAVILRLIGLLAVFASLFFVLWWVEGRVLHRERQSRALQDLKQGEYLTVAHVTPPQAEQLVGRLVTREKRKGDPITPDEVKPLPRDRSVTALVVSTDRSLGGALGRGIGCVDVWNLASPVSLVAAGLDVATVLAYGGGDKRLVFLFGPADGTTPGKLLAAKEPALSIGQCGAHLPPKPCHR